MRIRKIGAESGQEVYWKQRLRKGQVPNTGFPYDHKSSVQAAKKGGSKNFYRVKSLWQKMSTTITTRIT